MKTERLLLRKPLIEDAVRVLEIQNSSFVLQFNMMKEYTLEEMIQYLKDNQNCIYLIELEEERKVIGTISLDSDELRYGISSTMISYYLDESYTGKGYMKEALASVIDYLFSLGNDVISARVFADNIASYKLLHKLGFKHEGTLRHAIKDINQKIHDDMLFSLLKKEYKKEIVTSNVQ